MKYLGIDWGEKRIGVAIGDDETKISLPYKTVHSTNEILDIVSEEDIEKIILGQPIKMSGAENFSEQFNSFFQNLKEMINVPIELFDERLTSRHADSLEGDKKTKAKRDEIAAMLILQGYFDKLR